MFVLLIITLFGILFSFIATQNTVNVPIQLINLQFTNVPLYLVILCSLLIGIFLSWGLSLVDWASNTLALSKKNGDLKHSQKEISKLQNQVNNLQIENSRLRGEKEEIKKDYSPPSLLDRFRHIASI